MVGGVEMVEEIRKKKRRRRRGGGEGMTNWAQKN